MKKTSLLLLLFSFISLSAKAELSINITRGIDNPTKIAIAPLSFYGNQPPEDASKIIEDDLKRSGLFDPIPRKNMLSFPGTIKDIYFRDWKILGAEYLVVASLKLSGDFYQITYSLLEVHSSRLVFTKIAKGSKGQLRDLSHHISDEVYQAITGIEGAFSTKVAYVTSLKSNKKTLYNYWFLKC